MQQSSDTNIEWIRLTQGVFSFLVQGTFLYAILQDGSLIQIHLLTNQITTLTTELVNPFGIAFYENNIYVSCNSPLTYNGSIYQIDLKKNPLTPLLWYNDTKGTILNQANRLAVEGSTLFVCSANTGSVVAFDISTKAYRTVYNNGLGPVSLALVNTNIMYVCNLGNPPRPGSMEKSQNGFVSMVDLTTGNTLSTIDSLGNPSCLSPLGEYLFVTDASFSTIGIINKGRLIPWYTLPNGSTSYVSYVYGNFLYVFYQITTALPTSSVKTVDSQMFIARFNVLPSL